MHPRSLMLRLSLLSWVKHVVMGGNYSTVMVSKEQALVGRAEMPSWTSRDVHHYVNQNKLVPPFPEDTRTAMFGMGCFWGAERKFWKTAGVYSTQVGYSAGYTKNPSYEEVCSGQSGHNEVVRVIFYPAKVSYAELLKVFWESHDPTQGMRQGNDRGTQYRSGIYFYDEAQKEEAFTSKDAYQKVLNDASYEKITTEIKQASEFYYAEEYHQQYLAKNPGGYCGLGGTGVSCPIGLAKKSGRSEL